MAEKRAGAPATALYRGTFTVTDKGSKNYTIGTPNESIPRERNMPFLMGRDGKLYVDKTLVPEGAKGFEVTITPVS